MPKITRALGILALIFPGIVLATDSSWRLTTSLDVLLAGEAATYGDSLINPGNRALNLPTWSGLADVRGKLTLSHTRGHQLVLRPKADGVWNYATASSTDAHFYFNEAFATAGNDACEITVEACQFTHSGAVGGAD